MSTVARVMGRSRAANWTGKEPVRSSWAGVAEIVRFNWPHYVVALLVVIGGVVAVAATRLPAGLDILLVGAVAGALFWTVASLAASHWVYDRSGAADWKWLVRMLPSRPGKPRVWLNVHAGFDVATDRLRRVAFAARVRTIDLFDAEAPTEASLLRARRYRPASGDTVSACPEKLPAEDGSADAVLLLFAAHEVRPAERRETLFSEIARVLRPGGRVVVVEHARDVANLVAFGPGFFHFLSAREWPRLAEGAGLVPVHRGRITPFVRVFVWERRTE